MIVAAGRGVRAGGDLPKQWQPLNGHTSTYFALRAFADHSKFSRIVLVLHPDDIDTELWPREPEAEVVAGGDTRSASVLAGLEALDGDVDQVLIHDAARPCVSREVIERVLEGLHDAPAAAPAVPVVDALWRAEAGHVAASVAREELYRAQTPQGFHLPDILRAHRAHPEGAADDVALARRAGLRVAITAGSEDNLKITLPEDFPRADRILRERHGR